MTGREAPAGSAKTGDWVSNGMVFLLETDSGVELARVIAKLNCGASPDPLEAALAAGAWLPLQVGNQWIFRYNSRGVTSSSATWMIGGIEQRGELTYFVLSSGVTGAPGRATLLRSNADGRIYRIRDFAPQREELWLDPTAMPDPSAVLKIRQGNFTYKSVLGTFLRSGAPAWAGPNGKELGMAGPAVRH